ncbi:MAG TPA: protein kinase [Ktedonobacteraceae bacterium]
MGQIRAGRTCGNCGTLNDINDQFCSNCGYSLTGGPTGTIPSAANAPTLMASGGHRTTGALTAGNLLSGRYRIVRLVGKGGFGAVYEAGDERFQGRRVVAIKEMSDASLSPAERIAALQNFRQEADLLVQLRHPNLPDVSDFFEESGKAYLVMEFIEGQTLEKVQEDAGSPLDEPLVMGWALQLCNVLSYLHTRPQSIIFRDMKPSNVMVTKDGQIKLIDFGIARVFKSSAAKDTTTLGSRGYAPLEQYGRGQTDARSDIYALGATLYDLLTNTEPPDAATRRVNPLAMEKPRKINPRISKNTENIILKAMEEEPKNRFQSAAAMAQAIMTSGVTAGSSQGMFFTSTSPAQAPTLAPTIPASSAQPGGPSVQSPQVQAPVAQRGGRAPSPAAPPVPPPPQPPGQAAPRRFSRRVALIGGLAAAAVVVGGGVSVYSFLGKNNASTGGNTAAGGTISVNFAYSTEKTDWMQAALNAFHNSNPIYNGKSIQIQATALGSVDGANQILNGPNRPVAWSPASDLELLRLSFKWANAHPGPDIVIRDGDLMPQSLFSSPLVFAIWQERAARLLNYYKSIDWKNIYNALQKNSWADIGGDPTWGPVKFGQTAPNQSNSGLLTITLMAYQHYNLQRGLTPRQIQDPAFLKYLTVFETAVNCFGRSSGTYLSNMINGSAGPAQSDIITTYENLVLTPQNQQAAMRKHQQSLQLFYPDLNIESNHPFAILQGNWVNTEQQTAAKQFRDFLLQIPQQKHALQYGFRPSNTSVQLTDNTVSQNPFLQFGQVSPKSALNETIQPLAQTPGGDVVDALINLWQSNYGTACISDG